MKVSVYLGSSPDSDGEYLSLATEVGKALSENGHTIVYGGASVGTMKALADSALAAGGEVIGVFPEGFRGTKDVQERGFEVLYHGLSRMIMTEDFDHRKQVMQDMGDCALVLPGSFGTLDEMFTYACNRSIGKHNKQIYVLNHKGYYEPLRQLLRNMEEAHMMKEMCRTMVVFCDTVAEVMEHLSQDSLS